ncbi:MAG: hypothetical protein HY901_18970 [Deltaproteobacteria bacterium]|nr:hypothetical protein [Deltaproteobacteria bacterium]
MPQAGFVLDPVPDDGSFADGGEYFTQRGIGPPAAYRASTPIGEGGWLTVESYTRRPDAQLSDFVDLVPDPANPSNQVLRLRSQEHTDATVIRPTSPLPERYRISLRVGFPHFGDGVAPNGYQGGETTEPWIPGNATAQNGFYWLAILDALPRPHNNVWIHHHRKVVVDSDNHFPPWMEIWNGSSFVRSGVHPVMMFALDGHSGGDLRSGNPFYSYSAGQWQPSGLIRAVDAYLPGRWYSVSVERDGPRYTLTVSGDFQFGGQGTYTATIDAAASCVWHYPVNAVEAAGARGCENAGSFPGLEDEPFWPPDASWPDWFMFGDPHNNFYEGEVLYDDVTLEVP